MATGNGGVCWQCHFVAGCERGRLERRELEYVKISCRILTHQKWLFWGPGPFYTVSNPSIGGSNITGSDFGATPRFRSNLDSGIRGLIWIISHFLVSSVAWARKNSTWVSAWKDHLGDMILGFVYITWFFTWQITTKPTFGITVFTFPSISSKSKDMYWCIEQHPLTLRKMWKKTVYIQSLLSCVIFWS